MRGLIVYSHGSMLLRSLSECSQHSILPNPCQAKFQHLLGLSSSRAKCFWDLQSEGVKAKVLTARYNAYE